MAATNPEPPRKTPAVNSAPKQRGRPFPKGTSGNAAGKPRGARNRALVALEAIGAAAGEKIVKRLVDRATRNDAAAALVLARIWPAPKSRPVELKLPPIETVADAVSALAAVVKEVASGSVTPGEGSEIATLIEKFIRALEVSDLEQRIVALERAVDHPILDRAMDDSDAP